MMKKQLLVIGCLAFGLTGISLEASCPSCGWDKNPQQGQWKNEYRPRPDYFNRSKNTPPAKQKQSTSPSAQQQINNLNGNDKPVDQIAQCDYHWQSQEAQAPPPRTWPFYRTSSQARNY